MLSFTLLLPTLQKDLENILKETDPALHDYEELQYIWEQWRNNSGRLMRDLYNDYLDLENEAAELNGNVNNSCSFLRYH